MKLDGRTVWVTGASSGIGEALVPTLLERGARVVVSARSEAKLAALVERYGSERVAAVTVDLMQAESLEGVFAEAEAAFGGVDVLINNAGRSQRALALDTDMNEVRDLMELNFMAPVALSTLAAPAMVGRGVGSIVVVSSVAGYVATPLRSTYNASKFAVRGWFDALRAELHGSGVEVCIVIPGYVRTNIARAAVAGHGKSHEGADAGVDGGISPEQCAKQIVRAIERGKAEVVIGGKETLAVPLARFAPGIVRLIAPRFAPK